MGLFDSGVEGLMLTKAIVEVVDLSNKSQETKELIGCAGRFNEYATKKVKYDMAKAKIAVKKEASKLKQVLSNVTGLGLGDSAELEDFNTTVSELDKDAIIRRFDVQFNPSTLSLSGSGGGIAQYTNFGAVRPENRGTSHASGMEHIEMSVQLVFDETNNLVTFPGDILSANGSALAGAAGAMIANNFSNRPSVQTEVEGFLAAIRNEYTRRVAFCWGKMLYSGYVNRVSARYTLFNPSGKPVRATVDMSIVCTDASVGPNDLGVWQEKYKEFFDADRSYAGLNNNLFNMSNF